MSWIAKNDITGQTYGKKFESIYECQKFIDTELLILQYEWKRIAYMEEHLIEEEEYQKWYKKNYSKSNPYNAVALDIMARMQYAISKFGNDNHRSTNVIRCWHVQQKRFADGFDF